VCQVPAFVVACTESTNKYKHKEQKRNIPFEGPLACLKSLIAVA
jgi:hypothetical protein